MVKISKNLVIGVVVVVAIGIAILLWVLLGGSKPVSLISVEAKNGDITEQINLTGQVKASQGVDLAFESQGKIVANYVKVGDKIYAGQSLLEIDSSILQAQLKQAQAQLDTLNIDTVNSKANAGLQTIYSASLGSAQRSVSTAKDVLLTISDIQYNHFTTQNQQNITLQSIKEKAVNSLLGKADAGLWTSLSLSQLNGGAYGLVQNTINNPTQDNIDAALSATQTTLQDVSNLVNALPIDPALTSGERTSISLAKTSINVEIMTTSANIQSISSQKVNNSATITTTDAQIEAAKASINIIQNQISKTVIRALFNGHVDKDNAIIGSIVSPNVPVITISNDNLEIDTNIPEINVANVKVGSDANITLDAFGTGVIFPATVVSVDSAQSMVNGISVYGAKLKFKDLDERIKTGMTANINIISSSKSNVVIVPITAVIQKDTKYFVIVDKGNSQKESREVTVGLRDSKNIEIASGLQSGEKVLAY